ncbi:spondin-2-like isoform X2 [Ostrinia nubilalis]|uniref:spondin-2-like isoform X2 n=1 Tax=Ostrinia nubilalis TaxID=29057 RepID=UPI0030823C02
MSRKVINSKLFFYLILGFCLASIVVKECYCQYEMCDRRPFDTNTDPLPPDDRFALEIETITELYIPLRRYNVRLYSKDNKTTFMGFTIWLREDEVKNDLNSRKPHRLDPGRLHPSPDSPGGKARPPCNNTVIQSDITPKTSVNALWIAPRKENMVGDHCVMIYAIVAIKPDVWYTNKGPLSKRVCEDKRDADDIQPTQNDNCQVCMEARYQLTFQGMWSYNTHTEMFPIFQEQARFSDVVGASHSKYFSVYKYDSEASAGMKMLAEQGNTTELEVEIQRELGRTVRTVIKATAPAKTNHKTVTSFRANKDNHLVSLVTGIMPSPDWFLGVADLELCRETPDKRSEWAQTVTLNLYPCDAGTDSGKTFEAPNDETSPPQPIATVALIKDLPPGKRKAFARVRFDLVRTYPNPSCTTENSITGEEEEEITEEEPEDGDNSNESPSIESNTTTTTEVTVALDPDSSQSCPMTTWEDWSCDGPCEEGKRVGMRFKYRYHIVDGVVIKYGSPNSEKREVPKNCLYMETFQIEDCEEECTEETVEEETEATDITEDENE